MKRSRRSEYGKKRNRSKRHSDRKLSYGKNSKEANDSAQSKRESNKESSRKATEKNKILNTPQESEIPAEIVSPSKVSNHPVDYEVFSKNDKQYRQRTTFRRKRSFFSRYKWAVLIIAIFIVINLIIKIYHSQVIEKRQVKTPVHEELEQIEYEPEDTELSYREERKRRSYRIANLNPAKLIIGKDTTLTPKKSNRSFVKRMLPNATIQLPEAFTHYDTKAFPEVNIYTKDATKYFFYGSEKIEPGKAILTQWLEARRKYLDESSDDYFYYESGSWLERNKVRQTRFSYIYEGVVLYGAAILIEHNNRYHYFQLMEKAALDNKPMFKAVQKKLRSYVKLTLTDS